MNVLNWEKLKPFNVYIPSSPNHCCVLLRFLLLPILIWTIKRCNRNYATRASDRNNGREITFVGSPTDSQGNVRLAQLEYMDLLKSELMGLLSCVWKSPDS